MPSSQNSHETDSDSDVVLIDNDDVSNYNPEQILPQKPEKIKEIRTWLQPTAYNIAGGEYRKHLASYEAGTGQWLTSTDTYQRWLNGGKDESGLLWLKGIPGSGKSVMAAKLIHEIAESHPGCPVLFFFFRQIIAANHEPKALLCDWMDQILEYSPPLQSQLRTYVDDRRSLDSVSMEDMWKNLRTAFSGLSQQVFCVADALDEIDQGHDTFLGVLAFLGQWRPSKVKVLITSRPVPRVEIPLRKFKCHLIRLKEELVDVDIATYVQHTLSQSNIPRESWSRIQEAVPGRANGLFLYAKLAMDAFLEPDANVESIMKQLPADLNELYTNLLTEHAQRSGVPPSVQHLILQAVTHATRPLRLLELAEMIRFNSPDGLGRDIKQTKDLVRAACGPLLEILADETVSVIHHSFTEYLKGATRVDDQSGYPILKPGPVNAEMALACLRYLQGGCLDSVDSSSLDDEKSSPDDYSDYFEPEFRPHTNFPALKTQLRLEHPFFAYAASNWYKHINPSEAAEQDQAVVDEILGHFLGNERRRKSWIFMEWPEDLGQGKGLSQLHIAANAGLVSYTKKLLQTHQPDPLDASGRTPLFLAARAGQAEAIAVLISAGANPDHDESHAGLKPLHQAASNNHYEAARVLLKAGVDPLTPKTKENPGRRCGNAPVTVGHPPLKYACESGHLKTVEVFLPFIDGTETLYRGLRWAAVNGHAEVVELLLQQPDMDVNAKIRGATPLYLACSGRDVLTVKTLIRLGADPNILCEDFGNEYQRMYFVGGLNGKNQGTSCLHVLCTSAHTRRFSFNEDDSDKLETLFMLLVEAGADVHQRSPRGETLLHGTVNTASLTRMLLDAGADPNATDASGQSPLHAENISTDSLALLVEHAHADINLKCDRGQTPLHYMLGVPTIKTETLYKFLEYGPDCNSVDEKGDTSLHVAVGRYTPDPDVVKALLEAGADPSATNHKGETPLHLVRPQSERFRDAVAVLLEYGADINARDRQGSTLLLWLASKEAMRLNKTPHQDIDTLLELGASSSTVDFRGRTCLHAAVQAQDFSGMASDQSRLDCFLALGFDPQAVDYDGNGLLHELALKGPSHLNNAKPKITAIWKRLIALGLDLQRKNHQGRTPLHLLSAENMHLYRPSPSAFHPIDFVISETKNLNAKDNQGITPLHIAVTGGQMYVKKLLDAGADPTVMTNEGLTPLHIAARCRESNVVGMLLDALRARASSDGLLEDVADLRLQTGGDAVPSSVRPVPGVNAKAFGTNHFVTPLFYACKSGRPETVKLLLEAGADSTSNRLFQACGEFEREDLLWRIPRKQPPRSHVPALTISDTSRPMFDCANLINHTARLDEILSMLVKYGADPAHITYSDPQHGWVRSAIDEASECQWEYTAACLRQTYDQWLQDSNSKKPFYSTITKMYAERSSQGLADASRQLLKNSSLFKPGSSNEELFDRFLARREYYLIEELSRLGATFLTSEDSHHALNLVVLIEQGFASLVDQIGQREAEARLEAGDWHAFGDRNRPGLWFAKRELPKKNELWVNPKSLLLEAVQRELPNMEIVALLVEKFMVDVNEIHYSDNRTNNEIKLVPEDSVLLYLAQGNFWWQVQQALPYLIDRGADLNIRNNWGQTPLLVALRGDTGYQGLFSKYAARRLIEGGADVNAADDEGRNCLSYAQHDTEIVELLIKHGAIVEAETMFAAIDSHNVETLRMMLAGGNDPNKRRGPPTQVPLKHNPGSRGKRSHRNTRQNQSGISVLAHLKLHEEYPLFHAGFQLQLIPSAPKADDPIFAERMEIVETLLDHGADPFAKFFGPRPYVPDFETYVETPTMDVPNGLQESTVIHELFRYQTVIDSFLLLPALDVNHRDAKGCTLLHVATNLDYVLGSYRSEAAADDAGKVTVFDRLCFLGADVEARDNYGRNVLHYMIGLGATRRSYNFFEKSMKVVLAEHPKLVNQADHSGKTPLHYAIARAAVGSECTIANVLLAAGADALAVTKDGDNVLHFAAVNFYNEMMRSLFEDLVRRGVDVNGRNNKGETPLFMYAKRAKADKRFSWFAHNQENKDPPEKPAMAMLEKLRADFFARDNKGRGLLHVAASGNEERFKELMAKGLDVMLEDDAQQTPIDVAAASGNEEVLALFEKKD